MFANIMNQDSKGFDEDIEPYKDVPMLVVIMMCSIIEVMSSLIGQGAMSSDLSKMAAANNSGTVIIQNAQMAYVVKSNNRLILKQNGNDYQFPDDVDRLIDEGVFLEKVNKDGRENRTLLIKDPDISVTGKEMITLVRMLNQAGITTDFCEIVGSM